MKDHILIVRPMRGWNRLQEDVVCGYSASHIHYALNEGVTPRPDGTVLGTGWRLGAICTRCLKGAMKRGWRPVLEGERVVRFDTSPKLERGA